MVKKFNLSDIKDKKKVILLYGSPGTGKTTAIGKLKGKTLIIDVDEGAYVLDKKNKNIEIWTLEKDLSDLKNVFEDLEKKCPYDNICLDSISTLEKKMLTLYGRSGRNDGAPEMLHYSRTGFKLADYFNRLIDLPANIIITAWERKEEIIKKNGTKFNRVMPLLSGKTPEYIMGICGLVGHVEISEKEETAGERYIRLDKTEEIDAKDRYDKRIYCKVEDLIL